jgi:hypothetical protein
MAGRPRQEAEALAERRAMREADNGAKERRLRAAVSDVLDGTVENCQDAARGRGLSPTAVQQAVKAERARRKGGA